MGLEASGNCKGTRGKNSDTGATTGSPFTRYATHLPLPARQLHRHLVPVSHPGNDPMTAAIGIAHHC